jgi:hypothetical protein
MFVCLTQPVLEFSYSRQLTYITLQNIIIKYFWKTSLLTSEIYKLLYTTPINILSDITYGVNEAINKQITILSETFYNLLN